MTRFNGKSTAGAPRPPGASQPDCRRRNGTAEQKFSTRRPALPRCCRLSCGFARVFAGFLSQGAWHLRCPEMFAWAGCPPPRSAPVPPHQLWFRPCVFAGFLSQGAWHLGFRKVHGTWAGLRCMAPGMFANPRGRFPPSRKRGVAAQVEPRPPVEPRSPAQTFARCMAPGPVGRWRTAESLSPLQPAQFHFLRGDIEQHPHEDW